MDRYARNLIKPGSALVEWHSEYLRQMVEVDSRSFGVNEFQGDRRTPCDMTEILALAEQYLRKIGFDSVKINSSPEGKQLPNPILMAEIFSDNKKPTLLFYAHLDKQPYMDDEKFEKWGGIAPTQLVWNEDRTRAYGRGAADDLAGVTAIGMTVDALLKTIESENEGKVASLPCNIKVIYETEEEAGSKTLIDQIRQNHEFFESSDCVLITDVINPHQGIPGLTTCLRGVIQLDITLTRKKGLTSRIDDQTALYKLLSTLINEDHALAIKAITEEDLTLTEKEREGFSRIPTSVEFLRQTGGLLTETLLTVPSKSENVIAAQLRKSYANVRPGNRVSGSVIFGSAAARLKFKLPENWTENRIVFLLRKKIDKLNQFRLKTLINVSMDEQGFLVDIFLQSSIKNPHSGTNGGPFPVAELQLARIIDELISNDGSLLLDEETIVNNLSEPMVSVQSLWTENNGSYQPFKVNDAKAIIEIRLAAGNHEDRALTALKEHLMSSVSEQFDINIQEDKGASPWITEVEHPAFSLIMESLEIGYGEKACLYGCGGTIPFVPKLTEALGAIPPLCLGAYDPDSKMHEPGESMSVKDWLGCVRSMIYFSCKSGDIFLKN